MLYFVLIYVLCTVIFVFETAQAILWVPEIRDDSPRRGMHDLFHSSRLNLDNGPLEPGVGALCNQIVLERKG